eukprot:5788343-Pleurochrysis_carterae.AAC.1
MGAVAQGATGAHLLRPSPGASGGHVASTKPRGCALPSLKDGRVGGPAATPLATARGAWLAVVAPVRPPVRPSAPLLSAVRKIATGVGGWVEHLGRLPTRRRRHRVRARSKVRA